MNFLPERIYNASNCGDNCARWILAIAKKQDITINLYHLMDFGGRHFTAKVATPVKLFALWMNWACWH